MAQRVQKILSQWGIASRRKAEQMILAERVRLNGSVVKLGQKANPTIDCLEVDGNPIELANRPQLLYFLLNKPVGVVSTCRDPQNRPTVIQLFPTSLQQQGIYPVGRLDKDSTGALLLTNDGELTQITHPRYHLPKTYHVWVNGHPPEPILQLWRQGIILDGQKTLPAQVNVLKQHKQQTLLQIVLTEGRNRQIRRVAQQLGFEVLKLHRTAIGSIQLNRPHQPVLANGHYRCLTFREIHCLKDQVGSQDKSVETFMNQ